MLLVVSLGCHEAPDEPAGPRITAPSATARAPERDSLRGVATHAAADLASVPYLDGAPDRGERVGARILRPEQVSPGVNLFCSRQRGAASLFANDGTQLASYRFELRGIEHCELRSDGGIVGLASDRAVIALDAGGQELWRYRGEVHHAFWVDEHDSVFVLERRPISRPTLTNSYRVYEDLVVELDEGGHKVDEVSLLDIFERSSYRFLLPGRLEASPEARSSGSEPILDLLHPNQIEVFDGRLADQWPDFQRGNWLVGFRNVNTIAVVDPRDRTIRWVWGPGNLTYPHHPSTVANGRILVFDNGTTRSRLVEVDPRTLTIGWSYEPADDFFTATRGSAVRLANGNTLITESNRARAREVTSQGDTVWEWLNPARLETGEHETVWRLLRYSLEDPRLAAWQANSGRRGSG